MFAVVVKQVSIQDWYGQGQREIKLISGTAVWHHSGKPPLPIRWVLIRDPKGGLKPIEFAKLYFTTMLTNRPGT